jgi:hypothetical protein
VEGLFLILAHGDGTALVKPIVCSELLLPKPSVPMIGQISAKSTLFVGKSVKAADKNRLMLAQIQDL